MAYIEIIKNEIEKCSAQVHNLEGKITLSTDPDRRSLILLEKEQTEMYQLSLQRLVHSFNDNFEKHYKIA